jgi:uncharacterized protein with LGFP repeats
MKNQIKLIIVLSLFGTLSACNHDKKEDPTPVDTTPEYQKAIDAKFKSIGWATDGHAKFNNSNPVKTTGGKDWVQYYSFGDKKEAIYYSDKGAFAVLALEMEAYDGAGQDNFGTIVSDPKPTLAGACNYNDIITNDGKEGIIYCKNIVKGEIYKKYKDFNRWDGPLGLPSSTELDTPTSNPSNVKGKYNAFQKGTIWTFSKGTYGLWGKALAMYAATDWERGWLGLPIESCDAGKADNLQSINFQNGSIKSGPSCPAYFNKINETVLKNGNYAVNVNAIPCY